MYICRCVKQQQSSRERRRGEQAGERRRGDHPAEPHDAAALLPRAGVRARAAGGGAQRDQRSARRPPATHAAPELRLLADVRHRILGAS